MRFEYHSGRISTVLRIIKLILFPVPMRFRSGSGKYKLCHYFSVFCDMKNDVHVHSLEPVGTPSLSTYIGQNMYMY